jgi:hypothetical protein
MPSVDGAKPTAFVMPVSWDEVTWMVVPKREEVPPAMLRKALENGRKWEQVEFEGCDGISQSPTRGEVDIYGSGGDGVTMEWLTEAGREMAVLPLGPQGDNV